MKIIVVSSIKNTILTSQFHAIVYKEINHISLYVSVGHKTDTEIKYFESKKLILNI